MWVNKGVGDTFLSIGNSIKFEPQAFQTKVNNEVKLREEF